MKIKKKIKIISTVLVILCVACIVFFKFHKNGEGNKNSYTAKILSFSQASSKVIAAKVIAENKSIDSQAKNSDDDARKIAIVKMKNSYDTLLKLSDVIGQDEAKNEILQNLASDPATIKVSEDILTNLSDAEKYFGEKQAEARYYSTVLLDYVAGQGNMQPLADTISSLGKTLNAENQWPKKIDEDYVDLLSSYFKHSDASTFGQQLKQFAQENGLSKKTNYLFGNALYYSGQTFITPEQWKKLKLETNT